MAETNPDPQAANEYLEPDGADTAFDSAYEEESASTFSASLTSSILNYTYENGRRYHAFREGEYPLPNDEQEQDRLDLLHHIFKLILDGKLMAAPIPSHIERVLDFGTGTGIWAINFADEYPSVQVVGNDLSAIQPGWVPPNLKFIIDDVEAEWVYGPDEAFDFIHGRALAGSIRNWPKLYSEIYKHMRPGGWVEIQEYETFLRSDDDTIDHATAIKQWQDTIEEASAQFGKRLNVAAMQKQHMIDAGYVDVFDYIYKVPVGPWPKDPKAKEIGRYELVHMLEAVAPFTLALFTRTLGWSREETEVLMAGVRSDLRNRNNHIYSYFHFVYGRKPEK